MPRDPPRSFESTRFFLSPLAKVTARVLKIIVSPKRGAHFQKTELLASARCLFLTTGGPERGPPRQPGLYIYVYVYVYV